MNSNFSNNFIVKWNDFDNSNFDKLINEKITEDTPFFNPYKPSQSLGILHPPSVSNIPVYIQKIIIIAEATTKKYFSDWAFKKPSNNDIAQNRICISVNNAPGGHQEVSGFTPPNKKGFFEINTLMNSKIIQSAFPNPNETDEDKLNLLISLKNQLLVETVSHELFHSIQLEYFSLLNPAEEPVAAFMEGTAVLMTDLLLGSNKQNTQFSPDLFKLFPANDQRNWSNPILLNHLSSSFWSYIFSTKNGNSRDEKAIYVKYFIERVAVNGFEMENLIQSIREVASKIVWFGNFDQFSYYDQSKTNLCIGECSWIYFMFSMSINAAPESDSTPPLQVDASDLRFFKKEFLTGTLETINKGIGTTSVSFNALNYKLISINNLSKITIKAADNTELFFTYFEFGENLQFTHLILKKLEFQKGSSFTKTVNKSNTSFKYLIIGTLKKSATISITQETITKELPEVHITRWNCLRGTDHEVNPKGFSWMWASPDIKIGNRGNELIQFNRNNSISIRLRNNGKVEASKIKVEVYYQEASPYLSEKKWVKIRNKSGIIQELSNIKLDANSENWVGTVQFCPTNSDIGIENFAFKVSVKVPNDPTIYNKTAIHNIIRLKDFDSIKNLNLLFNFNKKYGPGEIIIAGHGKFLNCKKITFGMRRSFLYNESLLLLESSILPIPDDQIRLNISLEKNSSPRLLKKWDGSNEAFNSPSKYYFPITTNQTYPENIDSQNTITLYQKINGRLVGGISIEIVNRTSTF